MSEKELLFFLWKNMQENSKKKDLDLVEERICNKSSKKKRLHNFVFGITNLVSTEIKFLFSFFIWVWSQNVDKEKSFIFSNSWKSFEYVLASTVCRNAIKALKNLIYWDVLLLSEMKLLLFQRWRKVINTKFKNCFEV